MAFVFCEVELATGRNRKIKGTNKGRVAPNELAYLVSMAKQRGSLASSGGVDNRRDRLRSKKKRRNQTNAQGFDAVVPIQNL
jgi:hypothetical protein